MFQSYDILINNCQKIKQRNLLPGYLTIIVYYYTLNSISETVRECQDTSHALANNCPIYSVAMQPEFTCKVNLYNNDIRTLKFVLLHAKL